jgi:hypothetical protein
MGRMGKWAFLAALGASALVGSAYGAEDDDTLKTLIAECSGPNVSSPDIDGCLERARVMGETDPSPRLQTLTAKLERLAEQQDQDEAVPADAATPAPTAQGGGGVPAAAGLTADKAAPHAEMH